MSTSPVRAAAALVFLSLFGFTGVARAGTLAVLDKPFDYQMRGNQPLNGPFDFTYTLANGTSGEFPPAGAPRLFDGLRFSEATVGQTFRATPESDPDFATFADFLTNGANDWVFAERNYYDRAGGGSRFVGSEGVGHLERRYLYGQNDVQPPFDLAGSTITGITLRHDAFNVAVDSAGTGANVTGSVTITFEGVPEPTALALALPAAAALLLQRRPPIRTK